MKKRVLKPQEQEFKKLVAVAKMLTAYSPNGCNYVIDETYLDFGQDWKWTTIIRDDEVQVLSPRQWEMIMEADTPLALAQVVEVIRTDRYFGDK